MTNVCFAEAIKLGHGNGDRLDNYGGHAPTMEIVLVFIFVHFVLNDGGRIVS